jgi:hypothetical protein
MAKMDGITVNQIIYFSIKSKGSETKGATKTSSCVTSLENTTIM